MKQGLASLIVGFVFALGLGISGMTRPDNVVGFLDLFGDWNPTLIFVMVGGIMVHSIFYRLVRRRPSPLFSAQWHVPTKKELTPALLGGAFIFGIGWGLAGYCPGPAVTALASLNIRPFLFVLSMLIGMLLFRVLDNKVKLAK